MIAAKGGNAIADLSGETESGARPTAFELSQNYPNPFNAATTIEFELVTSGQVKLEIYNSLGQHISTLFDELMSAGIHSVDFDSGSLTSGLYFYRLTVDGTSASRKMVLMK